jgi:hypothetical protein
MEVIIAAVVAIGSSLINLFASNRQSAALEAAAAEQRAAAEAAADASRHQSDTGLLAVQFDSLIANEKNENTNAGLQAGVLIIGIILLGIIVIMKKSTLKH